MESGFWKYIEKLIDSTEIVIERPKDSSHPRFPGWKYPADYGYLIDTISSDGSEIDVWIGSDSKMEVIGFLETVDLQKMDCEIKLAVGCTDEELQMIGRFHNSLEMRAIYISRVENGDL